MKKTNLIKIMGLMIGIFIIPIAQSAPWSGYATFENDVYSVEATRGSWIVPEVTCGIGESGRVSQWIGIDGFIKGYTVEQIGTIQTCTNGHTNYWAFYEMYPQNLRWIFDIRADAGDKMTAEVRYLPGGSGKKFQVTLANENTGEVFTKTLNAGGKGTYPMRYSAEWIVEVTSGWGVPYFTETSFFDCYATINGVEGRIADFPHYAPYMNYLGHIIKPSILNDDGMSFSVSYA